MDATGCDQDYSDCGPSVREKLVVIDVSDVIGEAIRSGGLHFTQFYAETGSRSLFGEKHFNWI